MVPPAMHTGPHTNTSLSLPFGRSALSLGVRLLFRWCFPHRPPDCLAWVFAKGTWNWLREVRKLYRAEHLCFLLVVAAPITENESFSIPLCQNELCREHSILLPCVFFPPQHKALERNKWVALLEVEGKMGHFFKGKPSLLESVPMKLPTS